MIKNIYGDYIWKSKLDNKFVEEYKNEFLSVSEKQLKTNIITGRWRDSKVTSSFFNHDFISNFLTLDFNGMFSKKISDEMKKFFKELETFGDDTIEIDIPIKLTKIWYNEYNYTDYQETHCHTGRDSFYSFVYILKSTNIELDSKIVFENPRSSLFLSLIISQNIQMDNYKSNYRPMLNEGDLIIFPSHMRHYVTGHRNNKDNRISISGNINIL